MKHFIRKAPLLLLLPAALLPSCRHDLEKTSWDIDVLAPLLKSTLTIEDLVTDSLLQKNPDNTVSLVYRSKLYEFMLDSMFSMPDTTFTYNVKLKTIEMGDRSIVYPITLGQIARQVGGLTGTLILAAHGSNAAIPPIAGITSGDIVIDANEFFQSVTLISGWMDITLRNDLPVDITNLVFQLRNQADQAVIAQDTFPLIPAGTTVTDSADLSGKTAYGDLLGKILNMDSPGSGGKSVPIDTNDALVVTITVRDLDPYSATAVFPAQDIINEERQMPLTKAGRVQLSYIIVREGFVKIDVVSTIQDTLRFEYSIPSATFMGQPFQVSNKIRPAPPGDTSMFSRLYDFKGYRLDLTGRNNDTVNTWWQKLVGRIDSTGQITTLALTDSFYVDAGLVGVVPEYGYGYLGQDTFKVGPAIADIALFDNIQAGTLDLESVKVTMEVENGVGMDAVVVLRDLKSVNKKTSNVIQLTSTVIDSVVNISRAKDNPLTPTFQNFNVQGLEPLVENMPDEMEYALDLRLNPGSQPPPLGTGKDFIYHDYGISANLNIEMPLSLAASGLTLGDTSDFNLGDNAGGSRKVKEGTFTLLTDNGFPFDAFITLYLYDEAGTILDSLFVNQLVAAATLDAGLRVKEKKRTKLVVYVGEARMDRLYNAKRILTRVAFTTAGQPAHVKIYSDYSIDFKLIGDFSYTF